MQAFLKAAFVLTLCRQQLSIVHMMVKKKTSTGSGGHHNRIFWPGKEEKAKRTNKQIRKSKPWETHEISDSFLTGLFLEPMCIDRFVSLGGAVSQNYKGFSSSCYLASTPNLLCKDLVYKRGKLRTRVGAAPCSLVHEMINIVRLLSLCSSGKSCYARMSSGHEWYFVKRFGAFKIKNKNFKTSVCNSQSARDVRATWPLSFHTSCINIWCFNKVAKGVFFF